MEIQSEKPLCNVCVTQQREMFVYRGFKYHRCSACGLVTTWPFPNEAQIRSHYEREFDSGNYQLGQRYSEKRIHVYSDLVFRLKSYLRKHDFSLEKSATLDVGCFTGEFPSLLQSEGANAYGVELQERAAAIADQKLKNPVYRADLYGNNLPQNQFDVVSLIGVIEHVLNPKTFLAQCARVMKTQSFLMLQTPNSGSLLARAMRQYWPPYEPIEHIHLFSQKSLRKLLQDEGFVDIEFQNHFKKLPISYVVEMLQTFGPELHKPAKMVLNAIPSTLRDSTLPFYGGEMIAFARKA